MQASFTVAAAHAFITPCVLSRVPDWTSARTVATALGLAVAPGVAAGAAWAVSAVRAVSAATPRVKRPALLLDKAERLGIHLDSDKIPPRWVIRQAELR